MLKRLVPFVIFNSFTRFLASLWLIANPFIFTCKKKERYVWAYPSFLSIDVRHGFLFDSVLFLIRFQVFLVLCLVGIKCCET